MPWAAGRAPPHSHASPSELPSRIGKQGVGFDFSTIWFGVCFLLSPSRLPEQFVFFFPAFSDRRHPGFPARPTVAFHPAALVCHTQHRPTPTVSDGDAATKKLRRRRHASARQDAQGDVQGCQGEQRRADGVEKNAQAGKQQSHGGGAAVAAENADPSGDGAANDQKKDAAREECGDGNTPQIIARESECGCISRKGGQSSAGH